MVDGVSKRLGRGDVGGVEVGGPEFQAHVFGGDPGPVRFRWRRPNGPETTASTPETAATVSFPSAIPCSYRTVPGSASTSAG